MTDPLAVLLRDAWASWIEDPNRPDDFEGYAAARLFAAGVRVTAPPSDAAAPLREALMALHNSPLKQGTEDYEAGWDDAIDTALALTPTADTLDPTCCPDCGEPWPVCSCPTADDPSEYGRLLAERDRLIALGVDPANLDVPDAP